MNNTLLEAQVDLERIYPRSNEDLSDLMQIARTMSKALKASHKLVGSGIFAREGESWQEVALEEWLEVIGVATLADRNGVVHRP